LEKFLIVQSLSRDLSVFHGVVCVPNQSRGCSGCRDKAIPFDNAIGEIIDPLLTGIIHGKETHGLLIGIHLDSIHPGLLIGFTKPPVYKSQFIPFQPVGASMKKLALIGPMRRDQRPILVERQEIWSACFAIEDCPGSVEILWIQCRGGR
jgi:hypothetical protein